MASTIETSIENTAVDALAALNTLVSGATFTTLHKSDVLPVGGAKWIAYIIYS
tara:strand:+ start:40 stop:198 length:159 start_codon:yes stop_codon:yes gene_type:complete